MKGHIRTIQYHTGIPVRPALAGWEIDWGISPRERLELIDAWKRGYETLRPDDCDHWDHKRGQCRGHGLFRVGEE